MEPRCKVYFGYIRDTFREQCRQSWLVNHLGRYEGCDSTVYRIHSLLTGVTTSKMHFLTKTGTQEQKCEIKIMRNSFNLSTWCSLRGNGKMDKVLTCCAGGLGLIPSDVKTVSSTHVQINFFLPLGYGLFALPECKKICPAMVACIVRRWNLVKSINAKI